ncbi:MAG TPA: serine/threonine-protein kinase [Gemmatimonadales bacterium]|nr:serine/threonine-protein kinase [Gemmatimonadales bacterium]
MTDLLQRLTAALSGRYQIERELGQGGMATVYLARDLRHERHVALKVLKPELAATLGSDRFLREIRIAANLTHPHILPLHDSGEADGFLFYVMPYIEGESLRARLAREGELPVHDAARILKEVVDALAHAHTRGVVHRDIKPDNVLIAGRHALVTDFGVAKAVSEATGRDKLTTAGVALGTPNYMAPEQAAGDPHIDTRADIYAVGAMGYELLAGRPPFTGPSVQAVLAAHVTEAPRAVTEHRPAVPASLAAVIMRCLEKKPADRWQTADELLQQLDTAVTPSAGVTPTSARPASLPPVLADFRVGRRALLIAVPAIILAVALSGWLALRGRGGPPLDAHLIAAFPFQFSAGPDVAYLREGMVNLLESTFTGEGGLRAVASQTAIAAWKRAGGSAESGLTEEEERRVARGVGAGLMLRGGIVGSAQNLVISASLSSVAGSAPTVQASVTGSADSVATLVRRLVAQLLSLEAGTEPPTAASLADVPLPALRAYLEGQAAYRSGLFDEAFEAFGRALAVDSTFALAALYHAVTAGWLATGPSSPGLRLANRYRDRLSPRDQRFMDAYRPNYPAPMTWEQRLRAVERGVELLPDAAEAWFWLGDVTLHYGRTFGLTEDQVRTRAQAAFQRTLELNPGFGPAITHVVDEVIFRFDSARLRRLADSLPSFFRERGAAAMSVGVLLGDSARLAAWRSSFGTMTAADLTLSGIYAHALDAVDEAVAALEERARRAGTDQERVAALSTLRSMLWQMGQPRRAASIGDRMAREVRDVPQGYERQALLAALFTDGDTLQAAAAAARLDHTAQSAAELCALGAWRATHGPTAAARPILERMRALARTTPRTMASAAAEVCAAQLRLLLAPAAEVRAAALAADSVLRGGPAVDPDLANTANLALARAWESLGDAARARAASRRWNHFGEVTVWPLLREQGRLALAVADTAEAMEAWERYLKGRSKAEPDQRARDDEIRRQMAALVGERN